MAWPTDDLDVANMDAGTDSPALARPMFVRVVNRLKSIIAARGQPNGIATLDADGKIPASQLPASETQAGVTLFTPAGAYQQFAGRMTNVMLSTSAAPYTYLMFEYDYYGHGASGTGGEDSAPEVPPDEYDGYPSRRQISRIALGSRYVLASGPARSISQGIPSRVELHLTSNTNLAVYTISGAGLRLYRVSGVN